MSCEVFDMLFRANVYKDDTPSEKYELLDAGVDNLRQFANSYLMLSCGGEPMIIPKVVSKIIR